MLGSSGDIYAYATHISNHSIYPSLILFHPSQSAIEGLFNVANDRCRINMVSLELYVNVRCAKKFPDIAYIMEVMIIVISIPKVGHLITCLKHRI